MHTRHLIALFTVLSVTRATASVSDSAGAATAGYFAAIQFYNSTGIPPQLRHYAEVARFFTGCRESRQKQTGNGLLAPQKYQDDRVFRSLQLVMTPVTMDDDRARRRAVLTTARVMRSAASVCRQLETAGFSRP